MVNAIKVVLSKLPQLYSVLVLSYEIGVKLCCKKYNPFKKILQICNS